MADEFGWGLGIVLRTLVGPLILLGTVGVPLFILALLMTPTPAAAAFARRLLVFGSVVAVLILGLKLVRFLGWWTVGLFDASGFLLWKEHGFRFREGRRSGGGIGGRCRRGREWGDGGRRFWRWLWSLSGRGDFRGRGSRRRSGCWSWKRGWDWSGLFSDRCGSDLGNGFWCRIGSWSRG